MHLALAAIPEALVASTRLSTPPKPLNPKL